MSSFTNCSESFSSFQLNPIVGGQTQNESFLLTTIIHLVQKVEQLDKKISDQTYLLEKIMKRMNSTKELKESKE